MLNRNEIKRIAKLTGLKPYQQEKHYIQTLILRSIYSQCSPVFKGGTALMFIIGLRGCPRIHIFQEFSSKHDILTSESHGFFYRKHSSLQLVFISRTAS